MRNIVSSQVSSNLPTNAWSNIAFGGKVQRLFKSPLPDPPILSHAGLSPVNLLLRGARVTGAGVRAGPEPETLVSLVCARVSVWRESL